MKKLYRFHLDFGRMGYIGGVFVATHDELLSMCGHKIYFGDVLGKNSDVEYTFSEGEFCVLTDDQEFIGMAQRIGLFDGIACFNPVEIYQEQVDDGCYD